MSIYPSNICDLDSTCSQGTSGHAQQYANTMSAFPLKLHDLLEDAAKEGYAHIVCWLPAGDGFQIHDPEAMLVILQKYGFNQTKWKSFLRQLQNYGFSREIRGPNKGKCRHSLFIRGQREMCANMRRIKRSSSFENVLMAGVLRKTRSRDSVSLHHELGLSKADFSRLRSGTMSTPSFPFSSYCNHPNGKIHNNPFTLDPISTRNASFDFVPKVDLTKAHENSIFASSRYDEAIRDFQKKFCPAPSFGSAKADLDEALDKVEDDMDLGESTEHMCSLFLQEPSLEDTYG